MVGNGMSKLHEFENREALDTALAIHVGGLLSRDIEKRGNASLAVSGGNTPKGMFAALSQLKLPWNKVCITLVDERWVDVDSPDSNERLVRENLLQNAAADALFVGLKSGAANAEQGLAETGARLAQLPMPFSCVILGMGGDGHTASWFPQASNLSALLDPQSELMLGSSNPVTAPHQRITLTLAAVLRSSAIILHITGEDKRAVLAESTHKHHPIAAVTAQNNNPVSIWWTP